VLSSAMTRAEAVFMLLAALDHSRGIEVTYRFTTNDE
jgi:hypothetical protein